MNSHTEYRNISTPSLTSALLRGGCVALHGAQYIGGSVNLKSDWKAVENRFLTRVRILDRTPCSLAVRQCWFIDSPSNATI